MKERSTKKRRNERKGRGRRERRTGKKGLRKGGQEQERKKDKGTGKGNLYKKSCVSQSSPEA